MGEPQPNPPDLVPFQDDTLRWPQRRALIQEQYPSVVNLDWKKAFDRDVDLFGRLLGDILKADQAVPGRPGPRPSLDVGRAMVRLDEWMGKNPTDHPYTQLPFHSAFKVLAGKRSVRHLAVKCGLSNMTTSRLLRGSDEIKLTPTLIEMVAKAFGKNPSYFAEYRIMTIVSTVHEVLSGDQEHNIRMYESLWQAAKK